MEGFKELFETVAVGMFALLVLVAAFLPLSAVRRAVAALLGKGLTDVKGVASALIVVLAFILGAMIFPAAEDFFDKPLFGPGDDQIKAQVYGERAAHVLGQKHPEYLFRDLEQLRAKCGAENSRVCCDNKDCVQAAKRIYNHHKGRVTKAGGEAMRIERDITRQLFIMRGVGFTATMGIGVLLAIALLCLALATAGVRAKHGEVSQRGFLVSAAAVLVGLLLFAAPAYHTVTELERDYDNHILRSFEGLGSDSSAGK